MTNSREKGAAGEREWAAWLRDFFGIQAWRGRQFRGGPGSPDVDCPDLAVHWEVKRTERLRIHDAIHQAKTDSPIDKCPAVAFRSNKKRWLVIIDAEFMVEFAEKILYAREKNHGD